MSAPEKEIGELEELLESERSMFLSGQPATRSVLRKFLVVLKNQQSRIRELEKRGEDTEG